MPRPAQNPAKDSTDPTSMASAPPAAKEPIGTAAPAKRDARGALFRALVEAGAGAAVAYTASDETENMISERISIEVRPILTEMRQTGAEHTRSFDSLNRRVDTLNRRVDTLSRRGDALNRRVDTLSRRVDALGRRVDALTSVVAENSRRLDNLEEKLETLTQVVAGLAAKLDDVIEAQAATDRRLDVIATRLDSLRGELRLLWGALGLLVTALIAVFGVLFAG